MKSLIPLSILACLLAMPAASAKIAAADAAPVPVERLFKNLQERLHAARTPKDMAGFECQIGRLHEMCFVRNTEEFRCAKANSPDYYGGLWPDWHQSAPAKSGQSSTGKEHLEQAVSHFGLAVSEDPDNTEARLGLAWCLEQLGRKADAIAQYKVMLSHKDTEHPAKSIATTDSAPRQEAALYLAKLLDPVKDKNIIRQLKAFNPPGFPRKRPRSISPIVVPLAPDVPVWELMQEKTVVFNVDGLAPQAYSHWPSSKAAWLVYDKEQRQKITSGLQLFGNVTFWLFWDNGYEALAALDDNHDRRLDNTELDGLALWQDINGNGVSDPGEVKPLADFGITSLSLDYQLDDSAMPLSKNGVTFSTGQTASTCDWIFRETR